MMSQRDLTIADAILENVENRNYVNAAHENFLVEIIPFFSSENTIPIKLKSWHVQDAVVDLYFSAGLLYAKAINKDGIPYDIPQHDIKGLEEIINHPHCLPFALQDAHARLSFMENECKLYVDQRGYGGGWGHWFFGGIVLLASGAGMAYFATTAIVKVVGIVALGAGGVCTHKGYRDRYDESKAAELNAERERAEKKENDDKIIREAAELEVKQREMEAKIAREAKDREEKERKEKIIADLNRKVENLERRQASQPIQPINNPAAPSSAPQMQPPANPASEDKKDEKTKLVTLPDSNRFFSQPPPSTAAAASPPPKIIITPATQEDDCPMSPVNKKK